ncbi:MAG: hypothetical protein LBF32_03485 [Streptococcaceae bacterium]|nr:hypothetical protein [Streptococcaceae bacterium]
MHELIPFVQKEVEETVAVQKEKIFNRIVAKQRVLNGQVIGCVKRFRILSEKYRNRRKRFGLGFNLIAAIYNLRTC